MTITSVVTIGTAGTGATGTAGLQGLGDLFAALMGGVGSADDLLAGLQGGADDAAAGGEDAGTTENLMQSLLKLGDAPEMTVSGDSASVVALLQQVQVIYQKLVLSGQVSLSDLSKPDELAQALTTLGMPAEQAGQVASKINTMLELLKQQQNLDDKTEGSLAVMMMAAMMQQGQATSQQTMNFNLQITSEVKQTSVVAVQVSKAFAQRSATDVVRQLTAAPVETEASADTKPITVPGERKPDHNKGKADVVVNVSEGEAGAVSISLPAISAKTDVPAQPQVTVGHATTATENMASQAAVTKVDGSDVIEKAKGTTVYKLTSDASGTETLQAVKAVTEGADASTATQQNAHAAAQHAAAMEQARAVGADTAQATFADRLAQAQHAGVGHQVRVQMQPLLENGGGSVRMTLNPPELGKISIDLQIADGKVHGAISASDPAVVEQLARELHNFRQGLADAGLKLGDQGISLMLNNQNQQQGQAYQQGQQAGQRQANGGRGNAAGVAPLDEVAATPVASAAEWIAPDRVLDMRI